MLNFIKTVASKVRTYWASLQPNTRKNVLLSLTVLVLGFLANAFTFGFDDLGPSLFGSVVGSVGTAVMFYFFPPKNAVKS